MESMSLEATQLEYTSSKAEKRIMYRLVKRSIDIISSLVGVVILAPILLVTAVTILLEDGGSVIYRQERIGKGGKRFNMYKFRSMRMNADQIHEQLRAEYQNDEVSFKIKDDPRVTRVGKIIRKFNIDELPQLLNILKGDMSLVGPRPLPTYEYIAEQKQYGTKFIERYNVPQGLTCYWQISGRSEANFGERMQLDVRYARECGLRVDALLIIKTFLYTIIGKAAY